jgi:isoquinoline 1-oxidoreductase alpha subunit
MSRVTLSINGEARAFDAEPDMPLLWALRDVLGLTGTKYGCGLGQCGACTVLLDGRATRSCQITVRELAEGTSPRITTIEGLGPVELHPVQRAWLELDVPQCGYCQSGQILAAVSLLRDKPSPSDADIDQAMTNLCRCGTYPRIRRAIHVAARALTRGPRPDAGTTDGGSADAGAADGSAGSPSLDAANEDAGLPADDAGST